MVGRIPTVARVTAGATLAAALLVPPATAVAAPPQTETTYTNRGVSIVGENPCAENEFLSAGGWIRLDLIKNIRADRVRIRATLLPHLWHWYGWNEADPNYDPAFPTLGDPDWVYAVSGSSRDRLVLEGYPSTGEFVGEFTITGPGPSNGLVVRYVVTYGFNAEGIETVQVTRIDFVCPDGTVITNVPFTYAP